MRLWHYRILEVLPDSQLLAQKRECDLIWKDIKNDKKTNHILINYIWKYEEQDRNKQLASYYYLLEKEFNNRGFKFRDNCPVIYFEDYDNKPFKEYHNVQYLMQCFFNLQEKYIRGQKDFSEEQYNKLMDFVRKELRRIYVGEGYFGG